MHSAPKLTAHYEDRQTGPSRQPSPLANQRGMALIVALSLLAIMTVMGMMAMSISDTELSISGNYRALQESFFAADRAVNYAATHPDIFLATSPVDLYGMVEHKTNIQIDRSGLEPTTATDLHVASPLGVGPPPMSAVSDVTLFKAHYLMINATGAFPTDIANPARTEIETQVARIVPL